MDNRCFNYGMMYTEKGNKKDELVHSTPGCKKKKKKKKNELNTKPKKLKRIKKKKGKKKMERLSRSHPISLPHSGELFVIGCSRRKWKAKGFFRIGWDTARQSGQGLRNIPGEGWAFGGVSSS